MRMKRIKQGMSNSTIAGVDLGGSDSLATILSPGGEVADRFSFPMNEEGYALFSSRVSRSLLAQETLPMSIERLRQAPSARGKIDGHGSRRL